MRKTGRNFSNKAPASLLKARGKSAKTAKLPANPLLQSILMASHSAMLTMAKHRQFCDSTQVMQ